MTDFIHTLGTDFTRVLTYQDSAGVAINLTDYTCSMQIRNGLAGALVLDVNPVLVGSTGTITIHIPHDTEIPVELLTGAVQTVVEQMGEDTIQQGTGRIGNYSLLIKAPVTEHVTKLLDGRVCFVTNPTKGF